MSLKFHYGPYESHGIIRHKTAPLNGISRELQKLGFQIEMIPSSHLDRLTVEMRDREVYRCKITNLKFNIDYEDDEVAIRLVNSVIEAHQRIYDESNIPKYFTNKMGMRGIQEISKGIPTQDVFSPSVELLYEILYKDNNMEIPKTTT